MTRFSKIPPNKSANRSWPAAQKLTRWHRHWRPKNPTKKPQIPVNSRRFAQKCPCLAVSKKGRTHKGEERGEGRQFGICYFLDRNLVCVCVSFSQVSLLTPLLEADAREKRENTAGPDPTDLPLRDFIKLLEQGPTTAAGNLGQLCVRISGKNYKNNNEIDLIQLEIMKKKS